MLPASSQGILVTVKTAYLADRSAPTLRRFAFSYTVTIANHGVEPAQLMSRHWIIIDGDGGVEEVRGEGVVGKQPMLGPGEAFEYTSWCVLPTPSGSMHGTYKMTRTDGSFFDAAIAAFALTMPHALN